MVLIDGKAVSEQLHEARFDPPLRRISHHQTDQAPACADDHHRADAEPDRVEERQRTQTLDQCLHPDSSICFPGDYYIPGDGRNQEFDAIILIISPLTVAKGLSGGYYMRMRQQNSTSTLRLDPERSIRSQIAGYYRDRIVRGELRPGDRVLFKAVSK